MDFLLASSFSATTGQHMTAGLTSNFNVYLSSGAVLWKQGCCFLWALCLLSLISNFLSGKSNITKFIILLQ